jgi:FkbM family methyltransferase
MLATLRKIAQIVLRRWPRAYARAKRGYAWLTYRLRMPHESDFKLFAALSDVEGLIADVGANTGQSARSLRIYNRRLKILSFEPNGLLEPDLAFTKRLLGTGFDYRLVGLGDRSGRIMLSVPMLGQTPQTPWATADRSSLESNRAAVESWLGGRFEIVEVPIEIVRFDGLDLHPIAIKIDIEGFEAEALRGMENTLEQDEPLLMLEHNDGADEIIAWLVQRGYAIYVYNAQANRLRPTDRPRKTTNYFACTPGWLARFPQVAALIDDRQAHLLHASNI